VTLDFRLSQRDRLAVSYQYSSFDGWISGRTLAFAPNQMVASSLTPFSAQGVAGVGQLTLNNGNNRVRENRTYLTMATWRHDGPLWKLDLAVGRAYGKNAIRDMDKERFLSVSSRRTGVTIGFTDTGFLRPGGITVTDATGEAVDPYRLENYALNTLTSTPQRASDIEFHSDGECAAGLRVDGAGDTALGVRFPADPARHALVDVDLHVRRSRREG
jgi:hypothetical protein